jgi:hypothetical protein
MRNAPAEPARQWLDKNSAGERQRRKQTFFSGVSW